MPGTVLTEIDAETGVRTITLNRPERLNAINDDLLEDFNAALAEAEADEATRAVILTGAGRAFCAGDDLKEFDSQAAGEVAAREAVEKIQDVTRYIVLGRKIYVGAIHGWAVGGGLEWVIDCDFPILADTARLFFPEVGLGLFVTGAVTALLPRTAGLAKTKELILFGERFGAAEALEMGIAWKVVPEDELMAEARAVAERIAALPPMQARDVKTILNRALVLTAEEAMALETDATVRAILDPATASKIAEFGR